MKLSNKVSRQESIQAVLSIAPVILLILLIKAYPIGVALTKSFTNWDGLYQNKFIGLRNYLILFKSEEFWMMLRNNLFLLLHIPVLLVAGFIFAVLLYEKVFAWKIFRSISYFPQILSVVIIGYLFRTLFSNDGPVNIVLRSVGLGPLAIEWLGSGFSALLVIMLCLIWQSLGWQALLILGGLSSMQPSVLEAAQIDGAGYWRRLFKIIVPMLSNVVLYSCIVSVMWIFTGIFPFIFTLTQGGPGYETTTLDYMIYLKAFISGNQLGSACATAIVLLLIVMLLTQLQLKINDKINDWGE